MITATVQLLRPRRATNQRGGFDPRVMGVGIGIGESQFAAIQDAMTAYPIRGRKSGKRGGQMRIQPGDLIHIVGFLDDTKQVIEEGFDVKGNYVIEEAKAAATDRSGEVAADGNDGARPN